MQFTAHQILLKSERPPSSQQNGQSVQPQIAPGNDTSISGGLMNFISKIRALEDENTRLRVENGQIERTKNVFKSNAGYYKRRYKESEQIRRLAEETVNEMKKVLYLQLSLKRPGFGEPSEIEAKRHCLDVHQPSSSVLLTSAGSANLLSEIRAGITLKKSGAAPEKGLEEIANNGAVNPQEMHGTAGALAHALENRRNKIAITDSENEADDDSEWEDE